MMTLKEHAPTVALPADLLTVHEAATLLGDTDWMVRRYNRDGVLHGEWRRDLPWPDGVRGRGPRLWFKRAEVEALKEQKEAVTVNDDGDLLTVDEVAKLLDISRITAHAYHRAGYLPAEVRADLEHPGAARGRGRSGPRLWFKRADVEAYRARRDARMQKRTPPTEA